MNIRCKCHVVSTAFLIHEAIGSYQYQLHIRMGEGMNPQYIVLVEQKTGPEHVFIFLWFHREHSQPAGQYLHVFDNM